MIPCRDSYSESDSRYGTVSRKDEGWNWPSMHAKGQRARRALLAAQGATSRTTTDFKIVKHAGP